MKNGSAWAWLVKGAIYNAYMANSGPYTFGWPTSDEYVSGSYVYQNFELGKLRWSSTTGVVWIPN